MMNISIRSSFILVLVFVLNAEICHSAVYSPSGPVYNPNGAAPDVVAAVAVQPTATPNDNFITQTVYGFLDFTTTIGNTVMIFSPQSAAPEPPKPTVKTVTTVIETKPPATVAPENTEIKPSKTVVKHTEKPKEISSAVQIVGVEEKAPNVKVVKPAKPAASQVVASKFEVKPEPQPKKSNTPFSSSPAPKKEVHSKVETKQESSIVIQTQVNVVAPSKVVAPIVYSSIVEVHTSQDDEDNNQESDGEEDDGDFEDGDEEQHNTEDEDDQPVIQIGNNIGEPEYDFLSRQPTEFVEETFRVHNIRPSASSGKVFHHKPRPTAEARKINPNNRKDDSRPTGLVTKLGGTVVKDGVTTVHETSVIGTYISGKYAQVLQSTSQIFQGSPKLKPTPASSLRILKTAPPTIPKNNRHHNLEPTSSGFNNEETAALPIEAIYSNNNAPNLVRSSRRPASPSGSFKNRFNRNRGNNGKDENEQVQEVQEEPVPTNTPASKKKSNRRSSKSKNRTRSRNNRKSATNSVELATVSAVTEPAPAAYQSRRNKNSNSRQQANNYNKQAQSANNNDNSFSRRGYKSKIQPTAVENDQQSTSLYKFKLNRTPGRWQYKTTPKPRVTIRKTSGDETLSVASSTPSSEIGLQSNELQNNARQEEIDLESSSSINGNILNDVEASENGIEKEKKLPVETLKVEISTPAEFKDTYYEIATIKSPYTFQVGTVKNTRYVTVTSTIEKVFEPEPSTISPSNAEPLTENILATTSHIDKEHNLLDSSIATLPPIMLGSDTETPPLETLTETFSTTQLMLKTHILPVLRANGNNTSYTLTQTYHITRLVTATKTLPPMDIYNFVPSKTLNEFNSRLDEAGSELHLELEFGDENDDDDDIPQREFPSDLDLSNIGSEFDLSEVDKSNIPEGFLRPKKKILSQPKIITTEPPPPQQPSLSQEQLQQLALLRLYNPQAAAQIPQVITTSKPVIKLETLFESHVIPVFNGVSTSYSTISRPIATVSKTEFEYGTSTIAPVPIPQVPNPLNPLFPQQQQQQQFQITSTPVITQTIITATESKVLKLTFGAKTAYTTLFSTRVVPTQLTTYITQSVAVQPTAAAFPGYFPAPYGPYGPYVG